MIFLRCALAMAILAVSLPAEAFSYPEHFILTRHALKAERGSNSRVWADLEHFFSDVPLSLASRLDPEKFDLADIPALAGDHSVSPHHLVQRWLRGPSNAGSCQLRNLGDALGDITANTESPTVCASRVDNDPCNRNVLLAVVRQYQNGDEVVQSTADIDPQLATADCSYVCLAERGSTHFRLPNVPIEKASHTDTPNAALSYARWHTVALLIAGRSHDRVEDAGHFRAVAMIYELFALHYLQDGVAAGHMITPSGYGNMTILATHDLYNRIGVSIRLSEAVCERLPADRFPRLRQQCARPGHLAVVRGDHAIADQTVAHDPADVTQELAEFVTEVSLHEVLAEMSAPRIESTFQEESDATVAAFDTSDPSCAADWDCPARDMRLGASIPGVWEHDGFGALAMWPVLATPENPPPLVTEPGGGNLYVRLTTELEHRMMGSGSIAAGYTFLARMKGRRLGLTAGAVLSYEASHVGLGVHGAAIVHWVHIGPVSFLNEIGMTVEGMQGSHVQGKIAGYFCPISYDLTADRASLRVGILGGLTAGPDPTGWTVGLGISATMQRRGVAADAQ